ncbi:MAG: MarC family protein [Bacteroidaceae bacterium]|nr:MarC family protein [Bacteroidaceae bacterium]
MEFFSLFNTVEFFSAFIVLFAVIDPIGIMPIILSIRDKGKIINPIKAVLYSFSLMFLFFFVGDWILNLFGVDINSFAVAGALIIFLMAIEMVLDIEIFKDSSIAANNATMVPVVFPLLAGAGSFTTLLSLKAEYASVNILFALVLNAVVVFAMLSATAFLQRLLGKGGIYFTRKFFGIILLAISVKLFTSNLSYLISQISETAN